MKFIFRILFCAWFPMQFGFSGDVLVSGNTFGTVHTVQTDNLNQLGHSFSFFSPSEFSQIALDGFDAIWLDGFSEFNNVRNGDLISFMESGGIVLIQNPGFGSESLDQYPFGNELAATYQSEGIASVSLESPSHLLNRGLSEALLSNWAPTSAAGYFHSGIGSFSPLSKYSDEPDLVSIFREVGQGLLVYTQQPIGQVLKEQDLSVNSGPLMLLNNILSWNDALVLTAPVFIRESTFYLDVNGDFIAQLPSPNSDGIETSGLVPLEWELSLELGCTTVFGPITVQSPTWPVTLTIGSDQLPTAAYRVSLARQTVNEPQYVSPTVMRNGPVTSYTEPGVLFNYSRWLMHMPRKVGGFDGVIKLLNLDPNLPKSIVLIGFDNRGNQLGESARQRYELEAGEQLFVSLYGAAPNDLFSDPTLLDKVSHVAIWDPTNQTEVGLKYVSAKSGFGVWVDEIRISEGQENGQLFRMNSGIPSVSFYDGVAILNLKVTESVNVHVWRFDDAGNAQGEVELGSIAPGGKLLSVLSYEFETFLPNPNYFIQAQSQTGEASIQVLGLTGSGDNSFFASLKAIKIR